MNMEKGAQEAAPEMEQVTTVEAEVDQPNEITKFNFVEGIEEMLEYVKKSDFVAVDATVETTGFVLKNERFNPKYMKDRDDCWGTWYDKIKDREEGDCLLEVGLSFFQRNPENPTEVEVEVYNIPVLPACVDDNEIARFRGRTCVRVCIDSYGKEFATSVGFDINKPFYKAAPYLNRDLCEKADEYMKDNPAFMVASRKRALNPYLMPEVYENITEIERKKIIDRLRGISKVFEAIASSGIPVVGHNLFIQMIYIYKDFVEYLPASYPEYYDKMRAMFKLIYDTKKIAEEMKNIPTISRVCADNFGELALYKLLRNINQSGEFNIFTVRVSRRAQSYFDDALDICGGEEVEKDMESYCYVAGFDSLVSGLVFLDLISILQISKTDCHWKELDSKKVNEDGEEVSVGGVNPDDYYDMFVKGKASRFRNKLFGEPVVPVEMNRGEEFQDLLQARAQRVKRVADERKSVVKATVVRGIRTCHVVVSNV